LFRIPFYSEIYMINDNGKISIRGEIYNLDSQIITSEGYYRNASCALNLIFTFLLLSPTNKPYHINMKYKYLIKQSHE
jgi:hypothetical protein